MATAANILYRLHLDCSNLQDDWMHSFNSQMPQQEPDFISAVYHLLIVFR